jgi:hypothetical protein
VCSGLPLQGYSSSALPAHLPKHYPVRVCPLVLVIPDALESLTGGAGVEAAALGSCGGGSISQSLGILQPDQQQQQECQEVVRGNDWHRGRHKLPVLPVLPAHCNSVLTCSNNLMLLSGKQVLQKLLPTQASTTSCRRIIGWPHRHAMQ